MAVEAPGRRIVYANWGWDILAYLLGQAVGRPWHEHVHVTLLAPLGMERSWIGGSPDARGHTWGADGRLHGCGDPASRIDPPTGAGSLVSSAADLGLFLALHVDAGDEAGPRLLSRESREQMHRLQHASGRSPAGMGLGFRVDRWRGRARIAQGGDGLGTTHVMAGLPEEGAAVVLLTNRSRADALRSELAHAALCALVGEDLRPPAPRSRPVAAPTGRYRSIDGEIEVELRAAADGTVATAAPCAGAPTPWISRLAPLAERCFEGVGGMFGGCELVFEDDPLRFHGGLYPYTFEWVGPVSPTPPPA
jgi:CubicO group peptidase (beta-lactamase class C family)